MCRTFVRRWLPYTLFSGHIIDTRQLVYYSRQCQGSGSASGSGQCMAKAQGQAQARAVHTQTQSQLDTQSQSGQARSVPRTRSHASAMVMDMPWPYTCPFHGMTMPCPAPCRMPSIKIVGGNDRRLIGCCCGTPRGGRAVVAPPIHAACRFGLCFYLWLCIAIGFGFVLAAAFSLCTQQSTPRPLMF